MKENFFVKNTTRIAFVHCVDKVLAQTQMFGVHYMPVWAYTLASHMRSIPNIEILLFDTRIDSEDNFPSADIYLFTGINQDFLSIVSFFRKIKALHVNSKFLIGGPICWSYSQAGKIDDLSMFDHIVIGDGEPVIVEIIQKLISGQAQEKVISWPTKFSLGSAREMDRRLMDETVHRYYGAVIEVSRGCPFLCEFCDIRIQKDNNKSHTKSPEVILQEIEYFAKKGITQILFACDNFIGEPDWAEAVCDKIIDWKLRTGYSVNIYTWLTINVSNYNNLLEKLKLAGFDMFFIGIESFSQNQLLETAKIQNVKAGLTDAIMKIHSHGFIVVAGLIFGFDTEDDHAYQTTLEGIQASGLISGEPSLLMALPGTPLYKRMKYSNRLRDGKLGLGGYKYQTNIKYLKPREQMIENFQKFVAIYNTGEFQYKRFKKFCDLVEPRHINKMASGGYINPTALLKLAVKEKTAVIHFLIRILKLISKPERLYFLSKAVLFILVQRIKGKKLLKYFNFWFFVWSNSVIKFENLAASSFDIDSVDPNFNKKNLIPDEYLTDTSEPIPEHKIKAQRKFTTEALKKIMP